MSTDINDILNNIDLIYKRQLTINNLITDIEITGLSQNNINFDKRTKVYFKAEFIDKIMMKVIREQLGITTHENYNPHITIFSCRMTWDFYDNLFRKCIDKNEFKSIINKFKNISLKPAQVEIMGQKKFLALVFDADDHIQGIFKDLRNYFNTCLDLTTYTFEKEKIPVGEGNFQAHCVYYDNKKPVFAIPIYDCMQDWKPHLSICQLNETSKDIQTDFENISKQVKSFFNMAQFNFKGNVNIKMERETPYFSKDKTKKYEEILFN